MVVGKDEWRGDTRHVQEIKALRDVSIVTTGAYPADAAAVELRSQPNPASGQEDTMANQAEHQPTLGALKVEDRAEKTDTETRAFQDVIVDSIKDVQVGETRSLTSAGSPLSPADLSTQLFQSLRPSSIALRSGIPTISTTREKIIWPELNTDVSPTFYSEGGTIVAGDPAFTQITSEPQKIAHIVQVSNEVIDDSDPPVVRVLTEHLATMLALKLDSAVYVGGTALPGITGMNNIASTQIGGTIISGGTASVTSYPTLIKGVGLLRAGTFPSQPTDTSSHATRSCKPRSRACRTRSARPSNRRPACRGSSAQRSST